MMLFFLLNRSNVWPLFFAIAITGNTFHVFPTKAVGNRPFWLNLGGLAREKMLGSV
jgi:hypothetical protein